MQNEQEASGFPYNHKTLKKHLFPILKINSLQIRKRTAVPENQNAFPRNSFGVSISLKGRFFFCRLPRHFGQCLYAKNFRTFAN